MNLDQAYKEGRMIVVDGDAVAIVGEEGHTGNILSLIQKGNGTAVVLDQQGDNPGIQVRARGNAAAIEILQGDGEDAIVALGADVRCRQLIGGLSLVIGTQTIRSIGYSPNGEENGRPGDIYLINNAKKGQPWGWYCVGGEEWLPMGFL